MGWLPHADRPSAVAISWPSAAAQRLNPKPLTPRRRRAMTADILPEFHDSFSARPLSCLDEAAVSGTAQHLWRQGTFAGTVVSQFNSPSPVTHLRVLTGLVVPHPPCAQVSNRRVTPSK